MATKPYQTKASDLKPVWHELDAEGKTLGRLSTEIATILQGKHKPIYVPHLNTGDYVVVTNVEKIHVTGKKIEQKMYYRHSGYPGGLKEENLERVLAKHPDRALRHAVKGMLPKNALGKKMLSRLKLYASESHPHEAQIKGNAPVEETVIPDSLDKIRVISPDDPLTKGITEPPEQSADSSKTKTRKPKTTTVSKNTKNEADKLPEKPKTTPRKRRSPKSAAKTEEA